VTSKGTQDSGLSRTYTTDSFAEADADVIESWTGVVAEARLNPSLSPAWLRVVAGALADSQSPISLWVARGPNGRVDGVIPFYRSTAKIAHVPMRQIELASNLVSYHAAIPVSGFCADALDALLTNADPWDVFRANNIPLESEAARCIEAVAQRRGARVEKVAGERSPYLKIEGPWQDFIATKNKKFRYKWRKRKEDVEAQADVELRWFTGPERVSDLLRDIVAIEDKSWKAAAGTTIAAREGEMRYHEALLPYLANSGLLLANVLYKGSRPIAYSLCCRHADWIGHLKTSFDGEFEGMSPGAFVVDASVERAFELNAAEFDFLGDAAPHKLAWTDTVRSHADFFVFAPRAKTMAVAALKQLAKRVGWS
jgi:CelD/BcsL family acetyltransferase involved in cellulose biosynthesis